MPISKKTTAAKHGKVVVSVSVLGVAQTIPKLYCEKYGIILLKNQHRCLISEKINAAKREKRLILASVPGVDADNTRALLQ